VASELATPVRIVESYFDLELDRSALKKLDETTDDEWIDFAHHYRRVMKENFAEQFLDVPEGDETPLRLYFEPRMAKAWDAAVRTLHSRTPLLGVSPQPRSPNGVTRDDVSRMLAPLKKHLLIADSVYVRDNFYYCFDCVADSIAKASWRADPNRTATVQESVRDLKEWLPILVELRDLIESRALVFMPYYLTPSFPYDANAPALRPAMKRLRTRGWAEPEADEPAARLDMTLLRDPERFARAAAAAAAAAATGPRREYFNEDVVLGAWLNARLLHLDPVFPNRAMFDWAANLYFEEDPGPSEMTSDLISLDILPFGGAEGIGLDDLSKLRENEEVFHHIRLVLLACKDFIETNLGPGSSREGVNAACRSFLETNLDEYERRSILKFIDETPAAGMAVSIAIGAALIPVAPAISLIAGAVLTPQLARAFQRWRDPKRKAVGRLQALL
jgi:hypothetical protein